MVTIGTKVRRAAMALLLMMAVGHSSAFADTNACYDAVLTTCADALDAASWWEKPAVGLFCTAMLGGCVGDGWFN